MAYRPEIDGLRALAVVPVVLYHAGVSGFSGGFVGVDVFFVISGYLITTLIWPEIAQGRFSITAFYERRARRILPALFVVMAFSAFVAYRIFLNSDLLDFSNSLVATSAFVSNLYFLGDLNYFAAPAEVKPLLHTWSLAIEEQFYIFFPLLLLALRKYLSARLVSILLQCIALSFLISVFLVVRNPDTAFYLLHTRAWELLLGVALALGVFPKIVSQKLASVIALVGVVLILASVFIYDHSTPFPGLAALPPCLGTLLFIWANSDNKNPVGNFFSLKPIVGIGLISYSLYLWHWPLIVFTKYYLARPLAPWEIFSVILISLILAIASWRFIERPFRGKSSEVSRIEVFRGATVGALSLVLFGVLGNQSGGFQARHNQVMLNVSPHAKTAECFEGDVIERLKNNKLCVLGIRRESSPDFILWGDSHANALYPLFEALARKTGKYGVFVATAGCPPLLGIERRDQHLSCGDISNAVFDYLHQSRIPNVFIVGKWEVALGRSSYELRMGTPQVYVSDSQSRDLSVKENLSAYKRSLDRTLRSLTESGRSTWVMLQAPNAGLRVPQYLATHKQELRNPEFRIQLDEAMGRNELIQSVFFPIASRYGVPLLDPAKVLCILHACLIATDGQNLYIDDDHLSIKGAFFLEQLFASEFERK